MLLNTLVPGSPSLNPDPPSSIRIWSIDPGVLSRDETMTGDAGRVNSTIVPAGTADNRPSLKVILTKLSTPT